MNDHQNTSMRALLSHAAPAHDEEPPARDVIGPAIAWGERRRRLDRVMVATGAALAVAAVGAGAATLGNRPGSGAPIGPEGVGRSYTTSASTKCTLPNGAPGSVRFCQLQDEYDHFGLQVADGLAGYIAGKLPAGITVKRTATYFLELQNGGTTEYLYPQLNFRDAADGKEQCHFADCTLSSVADGTAALGTYYGSTLAEWAPDSGNGPRITIALATSAPNSAAELPELPPVSGSPSPAGGPPSQVKLLTARQIADIIGDPAFRQYAYQKYNQMLELRLEYQSLMASELPSIPGGYVSGSIPASVVGSGTVPSAPLGTPSGLASPPTVPPGTAPSSELATPVLPAWSSPAGTGSMPPATPGS